MHPPAHRSRPARRRGRARSCRDGPPPPSGCRWCPRCRGCRPGRPAPAAPGGSRSRRSGLRTTATPTTGDWVRRRPADGLVARRPAGTATATMAGGCAPVPGEQSDSSAMAAAAPQWVSMRADLGSGELRVERHGHRPGAVDGGVGDDPRQRRWAARGGWPPGRRARPRMRSDPGPIGWRRRPTRSKVSDAPPTTWYPVWSPKERAMACNCSGGSRHHVRRCHLTGSFLLPSSGWAGIPTGWRCWPSTSWKCSATWAGVQPPSCHMVATCRGVWKMV